MKYVMLLSALFVTASANADGFRCMAIDRSIAATVYNHTNPNKGTRTAAILVLSDPSIQRGNRTIATFKNAQGTLSSQGTVYNADVDLRYTEISRKGEYLLGTRLGELKTISMIVDFDYNYPLFKGESVKAYLVAKKRNGKKAGVDMECVRYLKN